MGYEDNSRIQTFKNILGYFQVSLRLQPDFVEFGPALTHVTQKFQFVIPNMHQFGKWWIWAEKKGETCRCTKKSHRWFVSGVARFIPFWWPRVVSRCWCGAAAGGWPGQRCTHHYYLKHTKNILLNHSPQVYLLPRFLHVSSIKIDWLIDWHDALLFSISGTGSFTCPVVQTGLDIPRPLITQSWVTEVGQVVSFQVWCRRELKTCHSTIQLTNHCTTETPRRRKNPNPQSPPKAFDYLWLWGGGGFWPQIFLNFNNCPQFTKWSFHLDGGGGGCLFRQASLTLPGNVCALTGAEDLVKHVLGHHEGDRRAKHEGHET